MTKLVYVSVFFPLFDARIDVPFDDRQMISQTHPSQANVHVFGL